MKFLICGIFFITVLSLPCYSKANNDVDSLIGLLQIEKNDTLRLYLFGRISDNLLDDYDFPNNRKNEMCYSYNDSTLALSQKLKDDWFIINSLRLKGRLYRRMKRIVESNLLFDNASALIKKTKWSNSMKNLELGKNEQSKSHSYLLLGQIALQIDALYNAIAYFEQTQEPTLGWYRAPADFICFQT